ncbi:MAG: HAD-IC family P-type ATPase [bacterium]|nr:HAD-IC family P-type ATPase [bacterium]
MNSWHLKSVEACVEELQTSAENGLSPEEARQRQAKYGRNELVDRGGRSPLTILWEQFRSAMVGLLIGAALVSVALQEFTDAAVIAAIVLLNAALGFFQDYRAEKALAELKKLAVPNVRVRRGGKLMEMSAVELVPGDIVLLEVGNTVPADGRLIESVSLKVQESALTGESATVEKSIAPLTETELPLGDRRNMVFLGTTVSYGHGLAVVTETGMQTELGHIADSLQNVKTEATPLQKRLAQLGQTLALFALCIVALVFLVGLTRGEDMGLMLRTALSLAVAVVPEGLPAVATVALALGAKRMLDRQALIRKLPAVETLGSVSVICSDKTGTLTENRMTVTYLSVAGNEWDLSDGGRQGAAMPSTNSAQVGEASLAENSAFALLLAGSGLCNDVELHFDEEQQRFEGIGDPTEVALVVAAAELGLPKGKLSRLLPRQAEIPFDSDRKRMTTIHRVSASMKEGMDGPIPSALKAVLDLDGDYFAFTKGAVDSLLTCCNYVWHEDQPQPMREEWQSRIAATNEKLAGEGMRVLGIAFRPIEVDALNF